METQDNQLVAANDKTIKFYDFVDQKERENNEKAIKEKEELQEKMKQLFFDLDKENTLKLNKSDTKLYLKSLAEKIGSDQFKQAAKVSDEAFDDVWFDFGTGETGNISWHKLKPMIEKLLVHEAELKVERQVETTENMRRYDEWSYKAAVKTRKKEIREREQQADQDFDN